MDTPYQKRAEKLFAKARSKKYPKNQLLHYQGDRLEQIYLIKSGFIKVYTILEGGDTRTMMLLSPGDIFPLAFSVTLDWERYQLKYFYQALTEVELKILSAGSFKEELDNDPTALQTYLAYMSASNEAILRQLEVMKEKKAINKLKLLLPYLISKAGRQNKSGSYRLKIKLSHQELADLSGVTRETTTALLAQLEKEGLVKQSSGFLIIKLPESPDDNLLG